MHTLEYDYNSQYLIVFHNKILFKYHLKLLHSTTLPCDVFTGIYVYPTYSTHHDNAHYYLCIAGRQYSHSNME